MKIVIKRSDGGVSIMGLAAEAAQAFEFDPELVMRSEVAAWQTTYAAQAVSWRAMPDDAIPEDKTFRDAWSDTTKELVVDIDMSMAREVWRNKMREARKPLLEAADIEFMQALERGSNVDEIKDRKRELRDVTADPAIDKAKTPEELKAVWPACLISKKG